MSLGVETAQRDGKTADSSTSRVRFGVFPYTGPTREVRRKSEYSRPIAVRKDFKEPLYTWGI
jgi:hypothetical protein